MVDDKLSLRQLSFDLPCTYQVWVGGLIDPGWSERLGGMTVHPFRRADGTSVTLMQGELPDQAALVGLLNNLYQMRFVVLAVLQASEDTDATYDP